MGTAPAMAKSNFGGLADRYRDAYRVAAGTVRFGNLVKRASLFLAGAAFALISLIGVVKSEYSDILGGLLFGGIILIVGYFSGMFWAVLGQFVRAMLDIAVNTSPHLQDSEKLSMML
jgi:hypothetical protein